MNYNSVEIRKEGNRLKNRQQPRASRWQLEQQRSELPFSLSEQQQSRQCEQQYWLPCRVCSLAQGS